MCDEEETDWSDYESGPYCIHWAEPWDYDEKCVSCGHECKEHFGAEECEHDGCDCKKYVDAEGNS